MRQLSLQEINNVSGAISANLMVDLTSGVSGEVIQFAVGLGLAYKEHAALTDLMTKSITFLPATFASPIAIAALFSAGYVATPYLFKAIDKLVPSE